MESITLKTLGHRVNERNRLFSSTINSRSGQSLQTYWIGVECGPTELRLRSFTEYKNAFLHLPVGCTLPFFQPALRPRPAEVGDCYGTIKLSFPDLLAPEHSMTAGSSQRRQSATILGGGAIIEGQQLSHFFPTYRNASQRRTRVFIYEKARTESLCKVKGIGFQAREPDEVVRAAV
jgi:hypothetical protein